MITHQQLIVVQLLWRVGWLLIIITINESRRHDLKPNEILKLKLHTVYRDIACKSAVHFLTNTCTCSLQLIHLGIRHITFFPNLMTFLLPMPHTPQPSANYCLTCIDTKWMRLPGSNYSAGIVHYTTGIGYKFDRLQVLINHFRRDEAEALDKHETSPFIDQCVMTKDWEARWS